MRGLLSGQAEAAVVDYFDECAVNAHADAVFAKTDRSRLRSRRNSPYEEKLLDWGAQNTPEHRAVAAIHTGDRKPRS